MKITIANGKDFWAGLMFVAFGLAFMIFAQSYSMGTAVRMGPAYFPTVLGGILAVLGGIILFESFVTKNKFPWRAFTFRPLQFIGGLILGVIAYYTQAFFHGFGLAGEAAHTILAGAAIFLLFAGFGHRSLWIVLFAVVLFGYLLKPLGLVPAIFAMTAVSAIPGFAWTRRDFQMLPAYLAGGLVLTYLVLIVSPPMQHVLLVVFGAVGMNMPPVLALMLVEFTLCGALAFYTGRYKWPHITAGQVTVLSFTLAVFSIASFVHGLGLPMNVWPSLWE